MNDAITFWSENNAKTQKKPSPFWGRANFR